MSQEFFRALLDALIELSHPLTKLARVMPWAERDVAVTATLPPAPVGVGRPALSMRLMAGLLYLKNVYNLSDEVIFERFLESCYRQYLTGDLYLQTRLPCDISSFTCGLSRLREAGLAELLARTIEAAKTMRAVTPNELRRVRSAGLAC